MAVKDWHFLSIFFLSLFYVTHIFAFSSLSFSHDLINESNLFYIYGPNQESLEVSNDDHIMQKRSIPTADSSNKIVKKINELNASQQQLLVHWAGEKSNVIICLARNFGANDTTPSAVFISYDYGKSFINKTDLFILSNGSYASIDKFYPHKLQKRHIIFVDKNHHTFFVTDDFGKNINRINVSFQPSEISFFPEDPKIFLVHDTDSTLWITRDFGKTFLPVNQLVDAYDWSIKWPGTDRRSLMIRRREPESSTLIALDNIYQDESPTNRVILTDVHQFSIKGDFMFATKKQKELYIWGPGDQGFHKAVFDSNLESLSFHVADASENRLLVVVAHSNSLSNLYVSEENHDQGYYFRLSLPNLFCYFPNTTWKDSWLSDVTDEAFADITKVQGLNGIYIASQVTPEASENRLNPEHLQTVITFNWGADWNPLRPPKYDHYGIPILCANSSQCSLHLSQRFSQLYPVARYMPILTSSSAPGLIMATGTVSSSLKGHAGVFISRDAGLTWHQVLRENYLFNFGDHGGVVTAVKFYKSSGETNEFLYSIDEGQTWKSYQFSETKIRVYGLMTEPGENTTVFTIFGSYSDKHKWMIVNLDVLNVFSYTCTADDYKMWSPSAADAGVKMACVMGRRETYQRRRLSSTCYNGKDYDRPVSSENCECDIEDFECDFGFVHPDKSTECIRNRTHVYDPYAVPFSCEPGKFYNRTKGYRKVDGDTCFGGYESHYLPASIPCPYNESGFFLLAAQGDRILRVDLSSEKPEPEVLPIKEIKNVIAIDFDLKNNCLFFADIKQDKIGRQCLNSGEQDIEYLVQSDMNSVEGMAFDWISNLLYFVDGTPGRIDVIRTDINHSGRMRKTILGPKVLKKPRGIALHPVAGYMYWTDWSNHEAAVGRANLDGSDILQLFKSPVVYWPNGITVDYIAERIFWVDAQYDYIASADLHGRAFRKILTNVAHPFSVAVFKDRVYWDDWKLQSIFVADKDHGVGKQTIANLSNLMGLRVYAHGMQVGNNSCSAGVNPCSHLCFAAPNGKPPVCACPNGFIMIGGKCMCPDGSEPFDNNTCPIKGNSASCSAEQFTCPSDKVCIPKLWVCDGDADCKDGSDEAFCNISTCEPPYFSCPSGKCIPEYWKCDIDHDCEDGSDELNCDYASCSPDQFRCNNSRCIRSKWKCDGEDDCKDNSDEIGCQTLPPTSPTNTTDCRGNNFLCSDNVTCIPKAWRCDGQIDCRDGSDEKDCTKNTCQEWQFTCAVSKKCIFKSWQCDGDKDCGPGDDSDETNCTTFIPAIPEHNHLNNGSLECKDWTMKCVGMDKCIPNWWKCDGVADCPDGSDEMGCPPTRSSTHKPPTHSPPVISQKCRPNQFRCDSGLCIDNAWVCDGMADCANKEDEAHCSRTGCTWPDQFMCRYSGGCVNLTLVCDGISQCPDASDELNCDNNADTTPIPPGAKPTCKTGFIPCDMNRCIPQRSVCNGIPDCFDGKDEGPFCNNTSKYYQVSYLSVDEQFRNSTTLHLYWYVQESHNSPKIDLEFMPSIAAVTHPSKPQKWVNSSWVTHHRDHTFTNLLPFTRYNMTVYIRVANTTRVFAPCMFTEGTTAEAVSSPVWNVTVTQFSNKDVQVSWSTPHNPRGIITGYIVSMSLPDGQPHTVRVPAAATSASIDWPITPRQNYTFWVVAVNGAGESNSSVPVSIIGADGMVVNGLRVTAVGMTWVAVAWEPVSNTTSSPVRYVLAVIAQRYPPYPKIPSVYATSNSYNYTNLAPGTKYMLSVRGLDNKFYSTMSLVTAKTQGDPLPVISKIDAHIINGTNIKISWDPPNDSRKMKWTYGIYYSPQPLELYSKAYVLVNTTFTTISGLESCESYLVGVGIVGPIGAGEVSVAKGDLFTQYDRDAPPKQLSVTTSREDANYIHVSWAASCPIINKPIGYILKIRDLVMNTNHTIELKPTSGDKFSHSLFTRFGARYSIEVGTTSPTARFAGPVFHNAPPAPAPHQLQLLPNPTNNSILVYWTFHDYPHNFPQFHYEVLVSEGRELDVSTAMVHRCSFPPLVLSPVKSGTMYTAAVQLRTAEGYPSDLSEIFSVITESSLASALGTSSGTLPIMISLLLAFVVAAAAAGVVFIRRRRQANLSNSFTVFSHYNSRSPNPTATFNSNDSLEDEDSPVIRGFSDDEPLVIP